MQRKTPVFVALISAAVLGFTQLSAQQAKSPSPLARLDGFVGSGTCTGHIVASGKNPAHTTTGRVHGETTLDGQWVVLHYDEDRTAANPKPFSVAQYVGYDTAKKHFVTVLFENTGASYSTGVSSGWTGKTITFDETVVMDGKPASFRDVFTNGEAGMSSHTGMMQDKSGKWVKTDEETCHKA